MSLWHLPRELYAEISRFLVDDIHDVSRLIRKLAKKNIVKDINDGKTYKNGLLHSFNDEPAIVYADRSEWYSNGKLHRVGKPAICYVNGDCKYYKKNRLHSYDDLPAIKNTNGDCEWYIMDERVR